MPRLVGGEHHYGITYKCFKISTRGILNMTHSYSSKTHRFHKFNSYRGNSTTGAATAFSSLFNATDECFINFDQTGQFFAFTAHHGHSKALQYRPSSPVAGAQRSLQYFGRKTIFSGCQLPSGIEPYCQWSSCLFQDRTGGH